MVSLRVVAAWAAVAVLVCMIQPSEEHSHKKKHKALAAAAILAGSHLTTLAGVGATGLLVAASVLSNHGHLLHRHHHGGHYGGHHYIPLHTSEDYFISHGHGHGHGGLGFYGYNGHGFGGHGWW